MDAELRGRDAVDVERNGRIVGVLRRESIRPSDAVESLLPPELRAEYRSSLGQARAASQRREFVDLSQVSQVALGHM